MRSFLHTLSFLFILIQSTTAQINLVGLTRGEAGRIIKYNVETKTLNTAYTLTSDKAVPWYNNLLQAKNGLLYGMTENGGAHNGGILFSYNPGSGIYKKLVDFNSTSGLSPYGSLVEGSNGLLYGMTEGGGNNNHGTIFSFNYDNNTLNTIHHFNGTNGRSPYGSLVYATDGRLYGMTESGGNNDFGTIFSLNPNTKVHSVFYHFDGTNGRSPYGSLIQATDGRLYGMTQFGGTNGFGVIFSILPNDGASYSKRAEFNWTNGAWPNSSLVQFQNKLYGMTESGGVNNYGVIFSIDLAGSSIINLSNFSETNGRSPYGSLLKASDNQLYGMTYRGGNNDKGVLFSFNPVASSPYKKLVDFNGTNGINPSATMIELKENSVLPLTLISFNAIAENKKTNLEWLVEREYDLEKYDVERSTDGIHFSVIGSLVAINSPSRHEYRFVDQQPAAGKNYYRLKIHEKLAAPHYSAIKFVNLGMAAFHVTVQPNPVRSQTNAHIRLMEKSKVQMMLYNAQGIMVKQWPSVTLDKGDHYIPLQLNAMRAGNYILMIDAGELKQVLQIVKTSDN